jgi:hypothetical protein
MPTVFGKHEGKGNGSKTVVPNISEVALSLHRDPGEVNKVRDSPPRRLRAFASPPLS